MTTNEKLVTKSSIEKMVAKAEAKLAEWKVKEEEMKREDNYRASAGIYRGINNAIKSLDLAKKLLAASNEDKKVYKVTGFSAYNQDGWGNTTSYEIR